jgi:hypothetical protein
MANLQRSPFNDLIEMGINPDNTSLRAHSPRELLWRNFSFAPIHQCTGSSMRFQSGLLFKIGLVKGCQL